MIYIVPDRAVSDFLPDEQRFQDLDDVLDTVEKVSVWSLTRCPLGVGEVNKLKDLDFGKRMVCIVDIVAGVTIGAVRLSVNVRPIRGMSSIAIGVGRTLSRGAATGF